MHFGRFRMLGDIFYGEILKDQRVRPWSGPFCFREWASAGGVEPPGIQDITVSVDLATVELLSPVTSPGKVICIGKNYEDHAREMGGEAPELPVVFSKFSSAVIGPGETVELPNISNQVDYEAELVVVIGRPGRNIPLSTAMEHVLGYTCGNDISARDWQKGRPGGQWLLGKTFDTFAPIGPWIVTPASLPDPHHLDIAMRLNGKVMQQANTNLLIYRIDYLIHHLSQFFRLEPGDLIFTGTPAGVGAGRTPPLFLASGDICEVEIGGIGILKNPIGGISKL